MKGTKRKDEEKRKVLYYTNVIDTIAYIYSIAYSFIFKCLITQIVQLLYYAYYANQITKPQAITLMAANPTYLQEL